MTTLILQKSAEKAATLIAHLERCGCQTRAFTSETAAIDYLTRHAGAEVIVMDAPQSADDATGVIPALQSMHHLRQTPVVTCDCLERARTAPKPIFHSPSVHTGTEGTAYKPALLVVDDEDVLIGLLDRVLSRDGYHVLRANSVAEARRLVSEHTVGFILSDIDMPGETGLDLLTYIKEHHAGIPMLMMTGNGSRYDLATVLSAGADGYLPKPFRNADLMTLIELMSGQMPAVTETAD